MAPKSKKKKDKKEPDRLLIVGKPDYERCDNKVVSARYSPLTFLPVVRINHLWTDRFLFSFSLINLFRNAFWMGIPSLILIILIFSHSLVGDTRTIPTVRECVFFTYGWIDVFRDILGFVWQCYLTMDDLRYVLFVPWLYDINILVWIDSLISLNQKNWNYARKVHWSLYYQYRYW